MLDAFPDFAKLLAVTLLATSITSLWTTPRHTWQIFFALFVFAGLVTDVLPWAGVLAFIVLAIALYALYYVCENALAKLAAVIVISLASVALSVHAIPGFESWQLFKNIQLSAASAPFSISFSFDKPVAGVLILGFIWSRLAHTKDDWKQVFNMPLGYVAAGVLYVYALSLMLGYTRFDITPSVIFPVWLLHNLLFAVIAEEALFRGVIQREIGEIMPTPYGKLIGLLAGAILFGIAHIGGGVLYAILATVAGLVYGYVYHKTGRIESACVVHVALNAGHFLFLTYPFAAGQYIANS